MTALSDSKATHVTATPALWGLLTNEYVEAIRRNQEQTEHTRPLPFLRVVSIGGEAMSSSVTRFLTILVDLFTRIFLGQLIEFWATRVKLINTYGVTEATVYQARTHHVNCAGCSDEFATLCLQTTHVCKRSSSPSLVGRPMPNVVLRILACTPSGWNLSETFQGRLPARVPIGVVGEIFMSGPQISRGYLNRPVLTKSKFLKSQAETKWYRTGDLAMWTTDGNIKLIGRTDFQVVLLSPSLLVFLLFPSIYLILSDYHQIEPPNLRFSD